MILTRFFAAVTGLLLVGSPIVGAAPACTKTQTVASAPTHHTGERDRAHHRPVTGKGSDEQSPPCGSHEGDCCQMMSSCAGFSLTGAGNDVTAAVIIAQTIPAPDERTPATPPRSVDPPPPKA